MGGNIYASFDPFTLVRPVTTACHLVSILINITSSKMKFHSLEQTVQIQCCICRYIFYYYIKPQRNGIIGGNRECVA